MVGATSTPTPKFFIFSKNTSSERRLDETWVYRFSCFFSRWSFQKYPVEVYFYQGSGEVDESSHSFSSYTLEDSELGLCVSSDSSNCLPDHENAVCLVEANHIPGCIFKDYFALHKVLYATSMEESYFVLESVPVSQGFPYKQEKDKMMPVLINGELAQTKTEWPELSYPLVALECLESMRREENANGEKESLAEIQGPEEEHKDSDEVSPVYSGDESKRYCSFQSESESSQQVTPDTSDLAIEDQPKYDERDYSLEDLSKPQANSEILLETLNSEIESSADAPLQSQGRIYNRMPKPPSRSPWLYFASLCCVCVTFYYSLVAYLSISSTGLSPVSIISYRMMPNVTNSVVVSGTSATLVLVLPHTEPAPTDDEETELGPLYFSVGDKHRLPWFPGLGEWLESKPLGKKVLDLVYPRCRRPWWPFSLY